MIKTNHKYQYQSLNSSAGIGPGSAESLKVDSLLSSGPDSSFLTQYGLHTITRNHWPDT